MPGTSIADLAMESFREVARKLDLPGACQIGYVVEDIEKACRLLGSCLGVKAWYRPRIVKQKLFYKDVLIEAKLSIAVGYAGPNQVELVQYDPQRDSLFEVAPADPETTPHHLGFFVRSVEAHRLRLLDRGMRPVQYGSIWFAKGHRTRVAYFDARNSLGHVVELIEHRVQGIYIGLPDWYVMLGAFTGHVERLHLQSQKSSAGANLKP